MSGTDLYDKKLEQLLKRQREFYEQGKTAGVVFRKQHLRLLLDVIKKHEQAISEALYSDLGKSAQESFLLEIGPILNEIKYCLKHLKSWVKPSKKASPLHLFPSSSYTIAEPLGVSLIISPWNYPFQLSISPLVAAIAAGNCAVIKPSPSSPACNAVITAIIEEVFAPEYVSVWEGGKEQMSSILDKKFDIIFYTGGSEFGKTVMQAASKNLCPVILELGGKSPCIVNKEADIKVAAKRIAWGKFLNSGQTCVAPDYVLVHKSVEEALVKAIKKTLENFYGNDAKNSSHYSHIINDASIERIISYLGEGEILCGGNFNREELYVEPTLIRPHSTESAVMTDEIFGPVLPILNFEDIEQVKKMLLSKNKPLALYYFGSTKKAKKIIAEIPSGGACINDVVMHLANPNLPFGGVGYSGMGKYHGKYGFMSFSHEKAVLKSPTSFDIPFRYVPFKYIKLIKKILG